MIIVEFIIVLAVICMGTRLKGMSLGILGSLGLAILVFFFHAQPTSPPFEVLFVMIAVVTAVGTMEAAGGVAYLIQLATLVLKRHPHHITFLSPVLSYILVFVSGTNHIIYSILPVIAAVAKDIGVRPERPLSVAVIAGLHAFLVSPIAVSVALLVDFLGPQGIGLVDILKVLLPATIGGVVMATLVVSRKAKDPAITQLPVAACTSRQLSAPPLPRSARLSVYLFLLGSVGIIVLGVCKTLRPLCHVDGGVTVMKMPAVVAMVMLSVAALIVLLGKVNPADIVKGESFLAGIQALVAILGIVWLTDTFTQTHQTTLIALIQSKMQTPGQFSIMVFILSAIIMSPSATIRIVVPLGLMLKVPPPILLASLPAVNGVFAIPSFPTLVAAVHLDSTGSTKVGKFLLNHSFMLPGLVSVVTAVLIALGLVTIYF